MSIVSRSTPIKRKRNKAERQWLEGVREAIHKELTIKRRPKPGKRVGRLSDAECIEMVKRSKSRVPPKKVTKLRREDTATGSGKVTFAEDKTYLADLLCQVFEHLSSIVSTRRSMVKWLNSPNKGLDNKRPIDLIFTETGLVKVANYLHQHLGLDYS